MSPHRSEEQELAGVGMALCLAGELIVVEAVTPGSPAGCAGVQRGDVVIAVDGAPAARPIEQVAMRIRGPAGTVVRVTLERAGRQVELSLPRGSPPEDMKRRPEPPPDPRSDASQLTRRPLISARAQLIINGSAIVALLVLTSIYVLGSPEVRILSPGNGSAINGNGASVVRVQFEGVGSMSDFESARGRVRTVMLEVDSVEVARDVLMPPVEAGVHDFVVDFSGYPPGPLKIRARACHLVCNRALDAIRLLGGGSGEMVVVTKLPNGKTE